MNCLKKTPVLNRQCLRHKIEELSPLLQNLSWGPTKDSLFRATWSYYASGCQERLSSIRRRIEQNARIVAPCKFRKDWTPTLTRKERKLPPGVDLEDHIYQEFVSCFRSAEGPAKIKSPTKQKEFKTGDFPTPELWLSWKREEEQVEQALKKCKDPYLKEELSKKLEQLKKLTSRRPLIVLPNQKEVHPLEASKKFYGKKSKRGLKSKEPSKQPGLTSKPGPYVNRLPKAAGKIPEKSKSTGRMALTSFENYHPSLETIGSTRHSLRKKHQPLKRREIPRNSQLDNARLSQTSKTSSRASKKTENLSNKFSKISYVSQIMEEKAAAKEKPQRRKSKNSEKKTSLPNDSMFLIHLPPRSAKKLIKEMTKETNPKLTDQNLDSSLLNPISYQPYKIPENIQRERGREASQTHVRQENPTYNEDLLISNQVKRKSISGRRRMSAIRKSRSWHLSGTSLLGSTPIKTTHKDNRKSISLKDTDTEPVPDFNQISPFDKLLKKSHKIPENNSKRSSNHSSIRSGSSNLPKFKYNGELIIPNQVRRKYSVSTRRKLQRMGNVRMSRSWHSSGTSILGKKDNRNNVVLQDTNPEPPGKLGDELSEDPSSIFGRTLNAPSHKPYEINSSLRSGSSILQQTNYIRDSAITNQVKRKSTGSTRRRMRSKGNPRSSHSSGASSLGYIPFKANRERKERIPQKEYVPELTFTDARSEAESTLSFFHGSGPNLRHIQVNTGSSHGWPLPVSLQRQRDYVSPFGQSRNKREEAKPTENKGHEKGSKDAEIKLIELRPPSEVLTPGKAKPQEMVSPSHLKISGSDHSHSIEDTQPNRQSHSIEDRPMVIADIVAEFMKSYGSKMSFRDVYPCLLRPNELDSGSPEIPLKEPQVKKQKAGKTKLKEENAKEEKSLEKLPSKRETEPCSVCNLVRRRQSELRPYMQRMQKQRQRMELKAYYTQKILKKQDTPEQRRPCARQVLTRCYQALSICRRLLELRRLQKSQECQN